MLEKSFPFSGPVPVIAAVDDVVGIIQSLWQHLCSMLVSNFLRLQAHSFCVCVHSHSKQLADDTEHGLVAPSRLGMFMHVQK